MGVNYKLNSERMLASRGQCWSVAWDLAWVLDSVSPCGCSSSRRHFLLTSDNQCEFQQPNARLRVGEWAAALGC